MYVWNQVCVPNRHTLVPTNFLTTTFNTVLLLLSCFVTHPRLRVFSSKITTHPFPLCWATSHSKYQSGVLVSHVFYLCSLYRLCWQKIHVASRPLTVFTVLIQLPVSGYGNRDDVFCKCQQLWCRIRGWTTTNKKLSSGSWIKCWIRVYVQCSSELIDF